MLYHIVFCLLMASGLVTSLVTDQQSVDNLVPAAVTFTFNNVPAAGTRCGTSRLYTKNHLETVLQKAWDCRTGPCVGANGKSYPDNWVNNGGNSGGTPRWTCGGSGFPTDVKEFPLLNPPLMFGNGKDQGVYRLFYRIGAQNNDAVTVVYCGVAVHAFGSAYTICPEVTAAAAGEL